MLSGAAQHHKRWPTILRKTDAMARAKRQNGKILDEIWRQETFESFQMIPSTKRVNRRTSAGRNNSVDVGKQSTNRNSCSELSNESVHLLAVDRATNFEFNNSDCFSQSLECLESAELSCAGLQAPTENKDRLLPTSTIWSIGTKTTSPSTPVGSPSSFTFLRLNIGGTFYLLLVDALLRADPNSFLAKFVYLTHSARIKVADGYLPQEDAYYFQRSPAAFESIFQYYASGVIHKPAEVCHNLLSSELDFWRIPNMYVGSCCKDEVATKKKVDEEDESQVDDKAFDRMMFGKLRRRMWTFLEKPGSSLQAKSFELSSTMFVAISVIGLSFATIPEFQVTEHVFINDTSFTIPHDAVPREDGKVAVRTEHPAFIFTEWICIAFFTVEYALRYFAAPRKLKFMLKPLNLVDLLAVIPFYLELILKLSGVNDRKLWDLRWAFLVVRILRVLRVIRIIKLGRFSSGLQTFGMTLKRSQKQLQMMTIVLLTGVVFFSTMIYFLEKDESGTPFSSIPAAYWWCIVTMTTVGYGDVVPVTTMGKIIASAAIMSGVLVLALPITIIVDNFIKVAQDEQQAEQSRDVEQKAIAEKELLIRMTPA